MSATIEAVVFVVAALVTWRAGVALARSTYELDRRLNLGDAFGGLVLLSLAGTLPELAITVSAAVSGHIDLAAGNLIGGIATQTMVLVLCDLAVPTKPLTYLVGSLEPVLEGLLVMLVATGVLLGALLPSDVAFGGVVSPASVGIVLAWVAGVFIIQRVRKSPKWHVVMHGSAPGRPHHRVKPPVVMPYQRTTTLRVALVFAVASLATLGAGVALEITGNGLADRAGINGVIFGATFLALATALPEISSGIASVRLGDHQLAVADVFGGNAFQLCLFLLADVIAAKPVLSQAGTLNSWLAALGIALTAIYATGVIVRAERPARIGPDSLLAIAIYAIGIVGLIRLS
jgi:cation:H+ antiporter